MATRLYGNSTTTTEQFIVAFDKGFSNASASLKELVKDEVRYEVVQRGHYNLEDEEIGSEEYRRHDKAIKHLITTEIVGEMTGKSYLFLSDEEFNQITASIPHGSSDVDFKEEFLKELDNIISAAVITELSNNLQKRMYGNVPVFVGKVNSKIEDAISDDFNDGNGALYINSISFSFKNNPTITPLFIWVMNEA